MWPRKLVWRLFFACLLIMAIPVALVSWYAAGSYSKFYRNQAIEDLKARAFLIASQMEQHLVSPSQINTDSLCKELYAKVGTRFTVIAPSGKVLGDSERNPDSMENHANRQEIIQALTGGIGVSDRYSRTLEQELIYVAVPVYFRGAIVQIVRTSFPVAVITAALHRLYGRILIVVALTVLLAALVSYLVSRSISAPIAAMKLGARRFAAGDFSGMLPLSGYGETDQLAAALNEMARRLNDTIQTITAQRNELDNAITRMKKLESMRKDFVANVSHELRTPLTSIKGFVETLQSGAMSDREESGRFLGIIANQVERLNRIVEDLLVLSKIEEDAERSAVELIDGTVCDVLGVAVETCKPKAEKKHILLDLSCEAALSARMDPQLLEQAVVNLIDNAIKYSDDGKRVWVSGKKTDAEIAIAVRDEGIGIEPRHLDRLFERFYRVDKARSRKIGGTGLGLSIVKHIALLHGGRVAVESAPGKGSTFTVFLPAPAVPSKG